MVHDLITAFVVACAGVTASELLTRIWRILLSSGNNATWDHLSW